MTVKEYLEQKELTTFNIFYNCEEFPLTIIEKLSKEPQQLGPFKDNTKISDIEFALELMLPEDNENVRLFKDNKILKSDNLCLDEDIYRHSELEYANCIIYVNVVDSDDKESATVNVDLKIKLDSYRITPTDL